MIEKMYKYDFEKELPYWESRGVRYRLGSAGSMILACPVCGAEHFRERISGFDRCFDGHGDMVPLTADNEESFLALWIKNGDRITTIEERRAARLEKEKRRAENMKAAE